jgi:fibronectin-binding autotransporter adhesin
MKLGSRTNIINVGTLNLAAGRETGNLQFNTSTGGLRLRGTGGSDADRANMVVGDRNTGSSTAATTTGTISLTGHPVDIKFGTLTLGHISQTANTNLVGSGVFLFDQGTVDVSTITMGVCQGNSATLFLTNSAKGTLTVGASGTLLIGSGGLSLANMTSTAQGSFAKGTLNVFGGTAICTNNIFKTTIASSTGTIAIATGTLFVQGKIGSPANPIDNFNVTNATLQMNVDASGTITTNAAVGNLNASGTTTIVINQATSVAGPTTFPLISYATLNGTVAGNFAVTVPGGYTGSLVDNSARKRIDLSITPNVILVPLVWTGATNGDWDSVTTNWLSGGTIATYTDNNLVVFDDAAATSTVNLTAQFLPISVVMGNSALNYTFTGTGSLDGTNTLTLKGSATTIIDNTGNNSFTGTVTINAGTLQVGNNDANGNLPDGATVVDNAALVFNRTDNVTNSSAISGAGTLTHAGSGTLTLVGANSYGATTISGGALQVGAGGTSGSLGSGSVTDNSSLIFNRSDNVAVANVITGSGGMTKNNNTLTLSGGSSFAGGLTADSGTVRLTGVGAPGKGTITVNPGGTVVLGALHTNGNIVLAGGTLGSSATLNPLTNDLTATASTTSLIYMADPQNLTPTDGNEMAWSNTLHGAGSIIVVTVNSDRTADSGNGFRLRGTTASDFSGTIAFSNNVKGELQTTVAGPFRPAGTGKILLVCGTYLGDNSTSNSLVSPGYSEFNLRNNSTGDSVFGNDVEILGNGFTTLDPLGSALADAKVTMGNLKIGNGQELGVDLAAAPAHVIVFPTVTLTGGTVRFSPKTPGFAAVASVGSDLSLGNISETSGSSITMAGLNTLTLTGSNPNTYSGGTTNLSGTLVLSKTSGNAIPAYLAILGGTVSLSANDQIADSATVNISGGTLALSSFSDTVDPVILASGSIGGSLGTLVGTSYDVQSGSIIANLAAQPSSRIYRRHRCFERRQYL